LNFHFGFLDVQVKRMSLHMVLGIGTGNPWVSCAVPIPVPMVGFTHDPMGFLVKMSLGTAKTVKK
jgi:hypothetical protein